MSACDGWLLSKMKTRLGQFMAGPCMKHYRAFNLKQRTQEVMIGTDQALR